MKEWLEIILALLPILTPTPEGKRLREQRRKYRQLKRAKDEKKKQRQRRYLRIKRLRKLRDKRKITLEIYRERLEEINRLYPNI